MDWGRNKIQNSGPIFMPFVDDIHETMGMGSLYFSTPLPDCLCRVLFRRYSPLSLEVVKKRTNVNVFCLSIFGRDNPDFSMADY